MLSPNKPSLNEAASAASEIKLEAKRLGFDLVGIAPAISPGGFHDFQKWLTRNFAGEMTYLPEREPAYSHPKHVLDKVASIVMLGLNYRTNEPRPAGTDEGLVSRYAWGEADYHDVIRDKMKQLARFVESLKPGCRTRGVVDTAPLLERDFARLSGLGWFGKNTMLINKQAGSWFFLAALLVDFALDADQPHETSHCGTCTRCLDACPTHAFPEPYVLDARKCISYLTIELSGSISTEFRQPMGEWLFGCDVCQDVCPWNNKAPLSQERAFHPVSDLSPANALELLELNEHQFRERFRKSPLWRPGRAGLLRNAAIVLGNKGGPRAHRALARALQDTEPTIRGAAAWALGRLGGESAAMALKSRRLVEDNDDVQQEIAAALESVGEVKTSQT